MALNTRIKEVEDAIVNTLINAAISGVNGIAFSRERRNGVLKPPYLHVFVERSPIDDVAVTTIREYWVINLIIMAVAPSYKSQDADQARDLALQAGSAMITDRTLGNKVSDTVRLAWHGDYTRELPEPLFGAAVELQVRFMNLEV